VYGSVTGKAQSIAEQIVEAGSREGMKVKQKNNSTFGICMTKIQAMHLNDIKRIKNINCYVL
jgi:hypothetical protein